MVDRIRVIKKCSLHLFWSINMLHINEHD